MTYQYKSPLENGYEQFKLTKKQHNAIFKRRQIKWAHKYEYYYNEHAIILHQFINWKGIVLALILSPISLLFAGLSNFKEFCREGVQLFNQKKYGSFVSDYVPSKSKVYEQVMEIIKEREK